MMMMMMMGALAATALQALLNLGISLLRAGEIARLQILPQSLESLFQCRRLRLRAAGRRRSGGGG